MFITVIDDEQDDEQEFIVALNQVERIYKQDSKRTVAVIAGTAYKTLKDYDELWEALVDEGEMI